jgi:hypothetical protein
MTTEDLIKVLAKDNRPRMGVRLRILLGLLLAVVLSLVLMRWLFGFRPDLFAVLRTDVALKTVLPAVLAASAVALSASLARPASGGRLRVVMLALATGVALLGFLGALHRDGLPGLAAQIANPMLGLELSSVLLLAAIPLVGLLWALGGGACIRPALTGAVAGFGAGAAGAAIYSLASTEDSVLFVVPIYGLAMALVALIGAIAGWKTLRW